MGSLLIGYEKAITRGTLSRIMNTELDKRHQESGQGDKSLVVFVTAVPLNMWNLDSQKHFCRGFVKEFFVPVRLTNSFAIEVYDVTAHCGPSLETDQSVSRSRSCCSDGVRAAGPA